jgi:hypothetical protein
MAGVAVGVVTAGDVSSQPSPPSGSKLQSPAAWSYIWTGCAALYLIGVYVGMINIKRGD